MSARPTPLLLWAALLPLGAFALVLLLWGLRVMHPPTALAGVGLAVLWSGLRRGQQWAFPLTIALALASGLIAFSTSPPLILLTIVVLVPVLACRRYFGGPAEARFCPHCGRELTRAPQAPCPVCAPEVGAPPK